MQDAPLILKKKMFTWFVLVRTLVCVCVCLHAYSPYFYRFSLIGIKPWHMKEMEGVFQKINKWENRNKSPTSYNFSSLHWCP